MRNIINRFEKNNIRTKVAVLAVIIIAAIALTACSADSPDETLPPVPGKISEDNIDADVSVGGIAVESIDTITGMYVEDGSFEVIDGIFTVTFKNNSDRTLQYAKLILTMGEEDYTFELTTIPAGASVRAMEMNKKPYVPSKGEITLNQDNIVWFDAEPSMCETQVEITPTNNGIVVKNISGETISAPLHVYYKNYADEVYIGGITYRAGTQKDLAPGEAVALSAKHFDPEASKLMFVTYAP